MFVVVRFFAVQNESYVMRLLSYEGSDRATVAPLRRSQGDAVTIPASWVTPC